MANGFARQVQGSGAASWENVNGVEQSQDFSNIFESAGAVAGEVFSGMAVDDLLGSDEIPTTSVSVNDPEGRAGEITHKRGLADVEELSGLNSIRAARDQGILSGTRAQTLATKRLNEALNQFPQYREQLLAAYDNTVDPLGGRGESIFDPTAEEELAQQQQEQMIKNEAKAREEGYDSYEDFIFSQRKMRMQAEQTAREEDRLQNQENVMKANAFTLTDNVFRNFGLVEAEASAFILDRIQQEGGALSTQSVNELTLAIDNAERQATAKLDRFRANPEFDYDDNLEKVKDSFGGLRDVVSGQSADKKAQAVLEQLKVMSETDAWSKAPAVSQIISIGNSAGLDLVQTMNKMEKDFGGDQALKKELRNLTSDPEMAKKFKTLITQGTQVANLSDEDMDRFAGTLNATKNVITDQEEREVMMDRLTDITAEQLDRAKTGRRELVPVDLVPAPGVAAIADPGNRSYFNSPKGKQKAALLFNESVDALMRQVERDAPESEWEIDSQGKVKGSMVEFSPARSGAAWSGTTKSKRAMLGTQNQLLNDVIFPALDMYPDLLSEQTSVQEYKQVLVDRLNNEANPPEEESEPSEFIQQERARAAEREEGRQQSITDFQESREDTGERNPQLDERNQRTREGIDNFVDGVRSTVEGVLPRREQEEAQTQPLEEEPEAEPMSSVDAVRNNPELSGAVDFIKEWEGFEEVAYLPTEDDVPTIGYGRTEGVQEGQSTTEAEEEQYLQEQVARTTEALRRELGPRWDNMPANQKQALVSLAYNVDKDVKGQLKNSKAMAALKRGDYDTFITEAFDSERGFVRQNGEVLDGLVNRRRDERQLFLYGNSSRLASI